MLQQVPINGIGARLHTRPRRQRSGNAKLQGTLVGVSMRGAHGVHERAGVDIGVGVGVGAGVDCWVALLSVLECWPGVRKTLLLLQMNCSFC